MLRRAAKRSQADVAEGNRPTVNDETRRSKKKSAPLGSKAEKKSKEALLETLVLGEAEEEDILKNLQSVGELKSKKKVHHREKPQAAWEDEDDTLDVSKASNNSKRKPGVKKRTLNVKVSGKAYHQGLKREFEHVSGSQSWAKLKWEKSGDEDSEADSENEDLLKSTSNYLEKSKWLAKDIIQMKQCANVNQEAPTMGKIRAVEFHPTAQVVLTGGADNTLRLFQVDGKTNPAIQSIFLEHCPIFSAHFSTDGHEVIVGSRHKSFYSYDMIAGKIINVPKIKGLEVGNMGNFEVSPDGQFIVFRGNYGYIHLISAKSKELITSLKMNGTVEALTFTKDGSTMLSHGDDGEVYVWDMRTRDCVHRFFDEGTLKGTALAISNNSKYIATGSYSGVVNIYDSSCLSQRTPKPLKAIMNLTTPCSQVKFNSATEILAISSDYTDQALRLVHFPSMTVFSNFPDREKPMHTPMLMDFSLNSGYFTVANNRGNALLYRVKHYGSF